MANKAIYDNIGQVTNLPVSCVCAGRDVVVLVQGSQGA